MIDDAGIAAAVRFTLTHPARLGATRLVAVDGPSGSGKTSLAGSLARALARAVAGELLTPHREGGSLPADVPTSMTSPAAIRPPAPHPRVTVVSTDLLATWEHPLDWWPTLDEHLLEPLAAGRTALMPVVEWISGNPRPGGHIIVPPVDVLVLEGVSSARRAASDRITTLVWVDVPDPIDRLERAVARDGEAMRPYLVQWQVDEAAHFAADCTARRADVVISG